MGGAEIFLRREPRRRREGSVGREGRNVGCVRAPRCVQCGVCFRETADAVGCVVYGRWLQVGLA